MQSAIHIILIFHVVAGGIALFSGTLAVLSRKGKKTHTKTGSIYFWSMMVVCASGFVLSLHQQNWFLFSISMFAFYFTFTGYRVLKRKGKKASVLDLAIAGVIFLVSCWMLFTGLKNIVFGNHLGFILAIFGLICFLGCCSDLVKFFKKRKKEQFNAPWLLEHITFLPAIVIWLTPTVIGTILITRASNKYKKKLKIS